MGYRFSPAALTKLAVFKQFITILFELIAFIVYSSY